MTATPQFCVKNTFLEFVDVEAMSTDDECQSGRTSRARARPRAKSDSLLIHDYDKQEGVKHLNGQVAKTLSLNSCPTSSPASYTKVGDTFPGCTSLSDANETSACSYSQDDATPRTRKTYLAASLDLPQSASDENEETLADQCPHCVSYEGEPAPPTSKVVTSQRRPARGSRNLNRLLAEAAKTARMIRETEMARRHALRQEVTENTYDRESMQEGHCDVNALNQSDLTRLVLPPVQTEMLQGAAVLGSSVSDAKKSSPSALCVKPERPVRASVHFSPELGLLNKSKTNRSHSTIRHTGCIPCRAEVAETLGASAVDSTPGASIGGEAPERPMNLVAGSSPTTMMMRNIPNNYTRAMLLELLNRCGFFAKYDFVYLPIDFKTNLSLGYAFVNVCKPADVDAFWHCFAGFKKWACPSKKICEVAWSGPQQGLGPNIERYQKSPVMHEKVPDDCKPAIFANGQRIAFPLSSKKLRAPRVRRVHGGCGLVGSRQKIPRDISETSNVDAIISGDEASWI